MPWQQLLHCLRIGEFTRTSNKKTCGPPAPLDYRQPDRMREGRPTHGRGFYSAARADIF